MSYCNPLLKGQPSRKPALHPPRVIARCGHRLWPDPGSCPVGSADLYVAGCPASSARGMAGLSLPEGNQRLCGAGPPAPTTGTERRAEQPAHEEECVRRLGNQ